MKKLIFYFIVIACLFYPLCAEEGEGLLDSSLSLFDNEESILSSYSLVSDSDNLISNLDSLITDEDNLISSDSLVSLVPGLIAEDENLSNYGSYVTSRESSYLQTFAEVNCEVYLTTEQEAFVSSYLGDYDKYIAFTLDGDSRQFSKLLAQWERENSNEDFYDYAESYVERENAIQKLLDNAKKKFGIGTAVILFDVALYFIPGGAVYKAMVCLPLKYALTQSSIGTVTGAVFGAVTAIVQDKDADEVFVQALSGAADGFMTGAITGTFTGWAKAIKTFGGARAISSDKILLKNNDLVDLRGKKIGFVKNSVAYDLDGNISGLVSPDGLYDDVVRYSKETWENAAENVYINLADETVGGMSQIQDALANYSYDYYADINAIMGDYINSSYYEYLAQYNPSYLSSLYESIDDIVYATTNTTIPETMSVWRGMTEIEYQALKEAGSFSKFLSTSVTGVPADFANNVVHMELVVEKGAKGIYMGKYSAFRAENEMLLAPSDIEILSEEVKDGKTIVKAVIRALTN